MFVTSFYAKRPLDHNDLENEEKLSSAGYSGVAQVKVKFCCPRFLLLKYCLSQLVINFTQCCYS